MSNKKPAVCTAGVDAILLSVGDGHLGILIEDVDTLEVERDVYIVAGLRGGGRLYAGGELGAADVDIQIDLCAHQLGYDDVRVDNAVLAFALLDELGLIVDMLGTDTEADFLADVRLENAILVLALGQNDGILVELEGELAAFLHEGSVHEVHLRGADEACYELVAGQIIQVLRSIDLLDEAVLHNDDTGTHGHSLGLIVCYIDEGGAELLIQLRNLSSHVSAELCVEVRERFVEEEYLRITDDCTTQRDTLSLTAGESLRLSVKILLDAEDAGSLAYAALDLFLRHFAELQTERHVVVYGHVGIQSVVLENHRDISVLGSYVVAQLVADVELALGDIFKTCDHAQGGGLTAAGRTYQNDKFLVVDLQVEVGYSGDAAVIDFVNMSQGYISH